MFQGVVSPGDSQPVESSSWFKIWTKALTQPSVETFQSFLRQPQATSQRAYRWIFYAVIVGIGIAIALISLLNDAATFMGADISAFGVVGLIGWIAAFIQAVAAGAVMVLLFALWVGISQLAARVLGGTGTYSKLAFGFATCAAPKVGS